MKKVDKLGKGIILMHDFQKHTAEALPELLQQAEGRRLQGRCDAGQGAGADAARSIDEELVKDVKLPTVSLAPGLQRGADDLGITRRASMPGCASKAMSSFPPTACWRTPTDVMPDELKFEGDKKFFTAALDRADLIVHGRNSHEDQPNSPTREAHRPDRARSAQPRPIRPIPKPRCGIRPARRVRGRLR